MEQLMTKEKSIIKLVLMMSLPNVISMLVNSMYNIVDSFFVAQISESAMTALSLVFPIQNIITSIGVGFGVGINALIALNMGANDVKKANGATTYGIVLSLIHGIILTILCILVVPTFLSLFTSSKDVLEMGINYARIAFSFSIFVSVGIAFEKIFQAIGDMKTSMLVMICGCVINVILDPILIFGLFGLPAMGIKGAALATGIGQVIVLIIYVCLFIKKSIPIAFDFKYLTMPSLIKKLYLIGIPATLNMALPSLLISCLNGILALHSQIYVVILGIYYKLQTFVYLPANGIIQGIRPLISFNYGAKQYERVKKIYHTALKFTLIIMLCGTIPCLVCPEVLMGMFSNNQTTIQQGCIALRIISLGFMVSSISVTTCGALEALGEGIASLLISSLRYIVLTVPMAFILNRILGVSGVWHSFWITEAISCLISILLYRRHFNFKKHS